MIGWPERKKITLLYRLRLFVVNTSCVYKVRQCDVVVTGFSEWLSVFGCDQHVYEPVLQCHHAVPATSESFGSPPISLYGQRNMQDHPHIAQSSWVDCSVGGRINLPSADTVHTSQRVIN